MKGPHGSLGQDRAVRKFLAYPGRATPIAGALKHVAIVRAGHGRYSGSPLVRRLLMSVRFVLLPVFVLVGLTFAMLLGMAATRTRALKGGETRFKDIALGEQ